MADNPFNALLDPSKQGTLTGMIGGLMGNPTASQAAGGMTGRALQELAALKAGGETNQGALMKWFQTPSGQEFFTQAGPDGLKSLSDGLLSMTPPSPTMNNIAPGGMLTATTADGGTKTVASNPQQFPNQVVGPQDVQVNGKGEKLFENTNQKASEIPAAIRTFQFMTSQISNLPKKEIERLALLNLDPNSGGAKGTVESEAWDELGNKFGVDPRVVQAGKAGALHIQPVLNNAGQDTGARVIIDISNPGKPMTQLIGNPGTQQPPGSVQPVPQVAPDGTTPATGAATGVLPAAQPKTSATTGNPAFGSKKDMALGASPVSKVLGAATKISEAIDPRLIIDSGAQANDRETMLNTLRSNLQSIGTIGGGLSSNKGLMEGYVKTYLDQGFFSASPHDQVSKLIRLHETATQNIEQETQRANDQSLPNEVKKQAYETVAGWQRVLQSMPTYNELVAQEKAIKSGTAGAPTIGGAAKELVTSGAKALTEGKKQVGEVQKATGAEAGPNIDTLPDKELLALDPRTLQRNDKIKFLRRLDAMKRGGASNGATVAR